MSLHVIEYDESAARTGKGRYYISSGTNGEVPSDEYSNTAANPMH